MADLPWEDNLLERKTESDLGDLLKTLVAFSNSIRPGHVGTVLIGERDDGSVPGVKDPDNIQKQVRKICDSIYPPILWRSAVYEKDGKYCVRVEVEFDGDTPHFAGSAWVRKGSESIKASDEIFQTLIDLRSSLVWELAKWVDYEVTISGEQSTVPTRHREAWEKSSPYFPVYTHRWKTEEAAKVVSINRFWITLEKVGTHEKLSEPLRKLTLTYDDKNKRLKIIIDY